MSYYVIKQEYKQDFINSNILHFKSDDLFLIYWNNISRLAGLYNLKKIFKHKKKDHYTFIPLVKYRRRLDKNDLQYNNIKFKFNQSAYIKISNNKFNKIIELLEQKNFQQTITDYLFFNTKDNIIEIDYIQNHPTPLNIKKIIKYNDKTFKTLHKFLEQLLQKIINHHNIHEFQELQLRIHNTFFSNFTILNRLSNRFISIKTDKKLSKIPFEVILLFKNNNFYTSRIIEINDIKLKNKFNFNTNIKFIYPKYKRTPLDREDEIKSINKKLKNRNYEIYKKSFKFTEFIKLLENSYIVHFSGHSVYNKKRKEYGLKINDTDIFYFSDFSQCLNVPDMITFNSCFDFKYLDHIHNGLKTIFQSGCKNILLPFTEIWEKQPLFFCDFYNYLSSGMEISKAYKLIINSFNDELKFYPMLFRLYGNPMEKYFKNLKKRR